MNQPDAEIISLDSVNEELRFAGSHSPDLETERAAREVRTRVMGEIDRLGLRSYVGDIEIDGYAILPPEVVGVPRSFVEELREKALEAAERDSFMKVDVRPDKVNEIADAASMFGQSKFASSILHLDPLFEKALMNEPMLAIMSYLLGESCRIQSTMAMKKGPGRDYMLLHADNNHTATPVVFPSIPEHANATWILTDYDEANGSTCLVKGSHRYCRYPTSHEARDITLYDNPITAKAGSILIHHGNVWHGSVPRRLSGYRVSVVLTFCRWYGYMHQQAWQSLSEEAFERNPPRFATLTGKTQSMGYGDPKGRLKSLTPFA